MTTATNIVNDALRLCNEYSDILAIDPAVQSQGFLRLVDMLESMRGEQRYVTPQIPASINDDLKEFSWAKQGLIFNLAELVAPFIQVAGFVPTFYKMQKIANRTLYVKSRPPTKQGLPETLPIGSGNHRCGWRAYQFYAGIDNIKYNYYEEPNKGEKAFYVADFDSDAALSDTSVSSVAWEVRGGSATISNISSNLNTSTALISFTNEGLIKVRARATYANLEVKDFDFKFAVNGELSTWIGS